MAIGCRLAAFIFILSVGTILSSEGFKFLHKKNVILLLVGSNAGPIGKMRVDESRSGISYSISGTRSLLDINKESGKLFLKRKLTEELVAELNDKGISFIIEAVKQYTSEKTTAKVFLKILPLFYGDKFVPQLSLEAMSNKNSKLPKLAEKVSPRTLLRFLRRSPEATRKIAIGHLKFEMKLAKVKKLIKQQIVAIFGKEFFISAYLHLKQLFSEKMMEEMEEDCVEETVAKPCLGKRLFFRTIDGTCNNLKDRTLGASNTGFSRIRPALYFDSDGLNDPIGYPDQPNAPDVPSPFEISNDFIIDEVAKQSSSDILTHAVMQMGQFIDHDLDLAVEVEFEDGENTCLEVPCDGSPEDRECPCYPILPAAGSECIRVTRSAAVCQRHGFPKPREQINVNTAFIDASQIYGSTDDVADLLREKKPEECGQLRTSPGPDGSLLPFDNLASELCTDLGGCFVAGDARSNEQQSLAAFHTLWLREHNRIARFLKKINKHWSCEDVYQQTRRIVGAVMQKIVYKDYLYVVLGPNSLPKYKNYDKSVDPGVSGAFATSAFRYGHSLIRNQFDILDNGFNPVGTPIELRFMFFNNSFVTKNGINPILLGLIANFSENVDRALSPGIIQNLFERPNSPGQNLAALNIQRSRDHGIPGYNEFRKFCKLGNAKTFDDTAVEIPDPVNRNILEGLYGHPDLAELWIAGLAEIPVNDGAVGATFNCIISDQLKRTRDGDRFFYERRGVWRPDQLIEIKKASLSRIYCDNLDVVSIQPNAFKTPTAPGNRRVSCNRIPSMDLCMWKDKPLPLPLVFKWSGEKCGRIQANKPVRWHATFVSNSNNDIVCSGALVSRKHVMTTSRCAQAIQKDIDGHSVVLGYYSTTVEPRARRSIKPKRIRKVGGIWRIELSQPIPNIKDVRPIAKCAFTGKFGLVTTWEGNGEHLRAVEVSIFRDRVCKKDSCTNVCPPSEKSDALTEKSGSPVVKVNGYRRCLVGLMTGVDGNTDLPKKGSIGGFVSIW